MARPTSSISARYRSVLRLKIPIANLRAAVGDRIETALPGDTGEIANALITGDRQGIPDETTEALRQSGLGHMLAISGLHMALVAGAVFGFLRGFFALSPNLALKRPIKKWAAAGALAAAAFYLVLSGASIATQRSFIMMAVMLVAVLLDRRAFSVRNVAVAATIVLFLTPEAILTASFQMSFAATLALIAGFEVIAERRRQRLAIGPPAERTLARTIFSLIGGLLLTSILAGLATAPFAAFQFNRTAPLSLIANLLAVPALSLLVMPMALVAVVLMPFGLEGPPLGVADFGIAYITRVADNVAAWTGSAGLVPTAPVASLLLVSLGLVWLCLWRQRWRLAGLPIIGLGLVVAAFGPHPDLLVTEEGETIAVRGADGRYHVAGASAAVRGRHLAARRRPIRARRTIRRWRRAPSAIRTGAPHLSATAAFAPRCRSACRALPRIAAWRRSSSPPRTRPPTAPRRSSSTARRSPRAAPTPSMSISAGKANRPSASSRRGRPSDQALDAPPQ